MLQKGEKNVWFLQRLPNKWSITFLLRFNCRYPQRARNSLNTQTHPSYCANASLYAFTL